MSMKKNKKAIQKKKDRAKEVRKRVVEKRLILRKERKDELLREQAFEKEFKEKSNLGLSNDEIKSRLEHNMKILEELEKEYDTQAQDGKKEKVMQQVGAIEKLTNLQNELLAIHQEKEALKQKNELTEEKAAEISAKLEELGNRMQEAAAQRELL